MRHSYILLLAATVASGCASGGQVPVKALHSQNTTALCQAWANNPDQAYRAEVANVLISRKATPERCYQLVAGDRAIMTGIALGVAGAAVGVAAANGGYGGGYYPQPGAYGVAWDQFRNQYHQPMWRCRDRASGQFVDDYRCAGMPMHDGTWPG